MSQHSGRALTFVDLFSGAGGLAEGFRQAGFRSVYAVEIDRAAAATYEKNFGHEVYAGPIEDLARIPVKADIVIGGPPCQAFSPLGKMSPAENHRELSKLWRHFLRIVQQVDPVAFVVENVPEFLTSREYELFAREMRRLGYSFVPGVLKAVEFGVPQKRKRGFTIAVRRGFPRLPQPNGHRRTVREAIGDLPLEPTGISWHIGRNPRPESIERYKCVPPGGNRFDLLRARPDLTPGCWKRKKTGSTDVFGRLLWDMPALTIRTEFFNRRKDGICIRKLTARSLIAKRPGCRRSPIRSPSLGRGSKWLSRSVTPFLPCWPGPLRRSLEQSWRKWESLARYDAVSEKRP